MEARTAAGEVGWRLWAIVPILLLALAVAAVVSQGDRVVDLVGGTPPPADELDVRRVELRQGEIRVLVRNPQREDVTIASVTVDDAIVPFSLDGPATLGRLRSSTVVVPYDWVPDEPLSIGVTTSTGIQTVHDVPAAVLTSFNRSGWPFSPGMISPLCNLPASFNWLHSNLVTDIGESPAWEAAVNDNARANPRN